MYSTENDKSAQSCGCDRGADHMCDRHAAERAEELRVALPRLYDTRAAQSIERPTNPVQTFKTGATRNTDTHKFDYEGFLNPEALHAFGEYMHSHRQQRDGSTRDSDNWQKGIPFRTYVKSLVRHTIDLWRLERGSSKVINPDTGAPHTRQELCCAIVFNAMGYLKELVDPEGENR